MRLNHIALAALAAVMLLAGCGSDDKADLSMAGKSARPFEVKGDVGAAKVTRSGAGIDAPRATVSLLPDGLLITKETKGSAVVLVRFGDARDGVTRGLTGEFGKPAESDNPACSTGKLHVADFGPITANFVDGKFVGWLAERGKGLRTGDGVSPDWSFRKLQRIGATPVKGGKADGRFVLDGSVKSGGMGGFVDSGGNVQSLYGGVNCFVS